MKYIVVEDEPRARNLIGNLINEAYPESTFLEAENLEDGVRIIKKERPQLVFLDIKLPGVSGLNIVKHFGNDEIDFEIIFTTAYNEFAIEAFKTSAIDFLLKPIDPVELLNATERALKNHENTRLNDRLAQLEKNMINLQFDKIALEVPKGFLFVPYDEIIYLQAQGMYTDVFIKGRNKENICKPLGRFAEQLSKSPYFYKPHRSYLINLKFIKEVRKTDGYYIVLENGKLIPVSRENKAEFLEIIEKLF
ncbi:DNA-binding response regulator [Nonlabens spongiae]|uniref:DNA-binding response regulator n=1 Tax=Nonlabens spongiae TaxID=331648 RepID=A0A1W6MNE1_9FLAO|nr:LytTR family DNA-binding domain-containing protein [Nonlabens spongiae]ARN78999.1 DNA-binding response regulator [Nonlabens spongiae]